MLEDWKICEEEGLKLSDKPSSEQKIILKIIKSASTSLRKV